MEGEVEEEGEGMVTRWVAEGKMPFLGGGRRLGGGGV